MPRHSALTMLPALLVLPSTGFMVPPRVALPQWPPYGRASRLSAGGRLDALCRQPAKVPAPQACEAESEASMIRGAVEALPVVGCIAGGAPWFAAVYVPLVALARQVDAPSGAAALAAALLYSSGAALLDSSSPLFELPMLVAALAALVLQQLDADAPGGGSDGAPSASRDDAFTSFDARLNDRVSRRRKGER